MYAHIDDDTALEMLTTRVKFWTDDEDTVNLFNTFYCSQLQAGAYDGSNFDPQAIVDNDYINWFSIGTIDDIKNAYEDFTEDNIYARYGDLILYYVC